MSSDIQSGYSLVNNNNMIVIMQQNIIENRVNYRINRELTLPHVFQL
jgi:hypothetical protein